MVPIVVADKLTAEEIRATVQVPYAQDPHSMLGQSICTDSGASVAA
jgi:hypothetical protein